jgi:hypothetical protein
MMILIALLGCAPAAAQDCEIPLDYANQRYVVDSDTLLIGIGTDRHVYPSDGTVHIYMVIQNLGQFEVPEFGIRVPWAIVRAYGAGCVELGQPGCGAVWPEFPFWFFDDDEEPGLGPGECYELRASWEIGESGELPDGEYNVIGAFRHLCRTCPPPVKNIPAAGIGVSIDIDSELVPAHQTHWGRIKALYR